MTVSDALIVGEGWISEHYFTTDATSQSFTAKVIERRKLWDAEATDDRPTARSRFTSVRLELEVAFGGLGELIAPDAARGNPSEIYDRSAVIHDRVLQVLELQQHGLAWDRTGALIRVSQAGMTDRAPLAVILAAPCAELDDVLAKAPRVDDLGKPVAGATLFEPVQLEENGPALTSAARLTSALFVSDDHPELVLILSGRWAVLAERERWAEGRYLAVDLQLVCERNDTKRAGEIDRALSCLEATSIAPDADGTVWWR